MIDWIIAVGACVFALWQIGLLLGDVL